MDTDTAGQNTGKDSLCGARLYEIVTPGVPFVVVDQDTGFIQVHTTDSNYIGTLNTIEIKVSLVDYTSILETFSFEVEITVPCEQVTIEPPSTVFMAPIEVQTYEAA